MDVKYLRRVTTLANHKREGRIGSAPVCLVSLKTYPKERLAKETYAEEMESCENRRTAVANLWRGQAFPAHLVIHPSVHLASNPLLSRTRIDATRCPPPSWCAEQKLTHGASQRLPKNPHPPCHDVAVPLMWSGGLAIIQSHHFLPRRATRQPAHASLALGTV